MAMLAALREEAEAADASLRPTVAEERAVLEAARQHVLEHGVNAKAGGEHGWVGSMRRKFERYLQKHGADVGYDAAVGIEYMGLLSLVADEVRYVGEQDSRGEPEIGKS